MGLELEQPVTSSIYNDTTISYHTFSKIRIPGGLDLKRMKFADFPVFVCVFIGWGRGEEDEVVSLLNVYYVAHLIA